MFLHDHKCLLFRNSLHWNNFILSQSLQGDRLQFAIVWKYPFCRLKNVINHRAPPSVDCCVDRCGSSNSMFVCLSYNIWHIWHRHNIWHDIIAQSKLQPIYYIGCSFDWAISCNGFDVCCVYGYWPGGKLLRESLACAIPSALVVLILRVCFPFFSWTLAVYYYFFSLMTWTAIVCGLKRSPCVSIL